MSSALSVAVALTELDSTSPRPWSDGKETSGSSDLLHATFGSDAGIPLFKALSPARQIRFCSGSPA